MQQADDSSDFLAERRNFELIPISPICDETVRPYVGRPVLAVMHDGNRHYGILRGIEGDRLLMDGGGSELSLASVRSKMGKNWQPDKAQTKAFYPYGAGFGFGFGAFALSLAALAALFFVPFFFI